MDKAEKLAGKQHHDRCSYAAHDKRRLHDCRWGRSEDRGAEIDGRAGQEQGKSTWWRPALADKRGKTREEPREYCGNRHDRHERQVESSAGVFWQIRKCDGGVQVHDIAPHAYQTPSQKPNWRFGQPFPQIFKVDMHLIPRDFAFLSLISEE